MLKKMLDYIVYRRWEDRIDPITMRTYVGRGDFIVFEDGRVFRATVGGRALDVIAKGQMTPTE